MEPMNAHTTCATYHLLCVALEFVKDHTARLLGCPGGGRGVGPRRDPSPPKGGMPGVPATDGCAPGAPYRGKGDRAESEKTYASI